MASSAEQKDRFIFGARACDTAAIRYVDAVYSMVQPTDMYVFHPNYGPPIITGPSPPPEHVTKPAVRLYGVLCLAVGAGIAWAVLCRPRRDFYV